MQLRYLCSREYRRSVNSRLCSENQANTHDSVRLTQETTTQLKRGRRMRFMTSVFLCAFLMSTVPACGNNDSTTEKAYIAKASTFIEQGNFAAASIELKNALLKNPMSPEARWMLGNVYLETWDGAGAEKELRRARELGVSDAAILPLLARALLMEDKPKAVIDLEIPLDLPTVAHSQLLTSAGLAYIATNDLLAAEKALIEATQGAKQDNPYLQVAQARLAAAKGDLDGAAGIFASTVKANPSTLPAGASRAIYNSSAAMPLRQRRHTARRSRSAARTPLIFTTVAWCASHSSSSMAPRRTSPAQEAVQSPPSELR